MIKIYITQYGLPMHLSEVIEENGLRLKDYVLVCPDRKPIIDDACTALSAFGADKAKPIQAKAEMVWTFNKA